MYKRNEKVIEFKTKLVSFIQMLRSKNGQVTKIIIN